MRRYLELGNLLTEHGLGVDVEGVRLLQRLHLLHPGVQRVHGV